MKIDFYTPLRDGGPYLVTAVVGYVARYLGKKFNELNKRFGAFIDQAEETRIKAGLAYDEVSARVPEVKTKFDFWLAHRG
jgi:hypothetical protein